MEIHDNTQRYKEDPILRVQKTEYMTQPIGTQRLNKSKPYPDHPPLPDLQMQGTLLYWSRCKGTTVYCTQYATWKLTAGVKICTVTFVC